MWAHGSGSQGVYRSRGCGSEGAWAHASGGVQPRGVREFMWVARGQAGFEGGSRGDTEAVGVGR